jgi:hypothetical protein
MTRAIEATDDPQTLQKLAKQLLQAWHSQKAATQWVMRQQLGSPTKLMAELGNDQAALESLFSLPTDDASEASDASDVI